MRKILVGLAAGFLLLASGIGVSAKEKPARSEGVNCSQSTGTAQVNEGETSTDKGARDDAKDTAKDESKDETKHESEDAAKAGAKDTAKDESKDKTKHESEDTAKAGAKDTVKDKVETECSDNSDSIGESETGPQSGTEIRDRERE